MRRLTKEDLRKLNVLDIAPRRLAEWEEHEDHIVVIRPIPEGGGLKRWVNRLLYEMSSKRLKLDEVGSVAWLHMDGVKTVGEIADVLRDRFGDAVEPAEERLGQLVWVMRREWLVEYSGIDDQ
ncbi:MAG: PqqD family protein [Gemmatimonadales bacterium]|jgi:hypothetical protein